MRTQGALAPDAARCVVAATPLCADIAALSPPLNTRAGALVLKVTRLVDGSGVWVNPHRLRHLNGPRLLLIDGGKCDEPCAKLRHA